MKINDAIIGAVLVVFAIIVISYTRTFPSLHGQSYGPDLFPILISLGLIGCGAILIIKGIASKKQNTQQPWITVPVLADNADIGINFVLVLLALLIYILFSTTLGFIPLSILILAVLTYRLGSSISVSLLTAILATVLIQLLFAKVLLVPLPAGLAQGIIW